MSEQLNIFDALASLNPTRLMVEMEPEPGWIWARCVKCAEARYVKRKKPLGACVLTSGCKGAMAPYLETNCATCGKPVTARRRDADTRFCSKKCEA